MKMVNVKIKLIIGTMLLILLPSIFAANGCFTYKESPYFCSDISEKQAEQECQLYGCNLEQSFYPERSCSEKEILQKCELSSVVNVPEELPAVSELIQKIDEEMEEENETNYLLILGIIIFLGAIIIIYLTYKKNPELIKTLFSKKKYLQKPPLNAINKTPSWLRPKDNLKLKQQKLKWKKKHSHKINEFQRDQLLQGFGPKPEQEQSVTKEFRKLKGLVRRYKRKKKFIHKSNSREHFIKLEQLGKKIKEKEQTIIRDYNQINPEIIRKHELDKLMNDLKEISKGNL